MDSGVKVFNCVNKGMEVRSYGGDLKRRGSLLYFLG